MKTILNLCLICLVCSVSAQAENLTLEIGRQTVNAEIADTPKAREHGLMQRDHLCVDCGMLFIFPVEKPYGFWMKDTPLPLSIAFIARNGRVINITEMRPYSLELHYAEGNALYALEMESGWFAAHGIKPGDQIKGVIKRKPHSGGNSR